MSGLMLWKPHRHLTACALTWLTLTEGGAFRAAAEFGTTPGVQPLPVLERVDALHEKWAVGFARDSARYGRWCLARACRACIRDENQPNSVRPESPLARSTRMRLPVLNRYAVGMTATSIFVTAPG